MPTRRVVYPIEAMRRAKARKIAKLVKQAEAVKSFKDNRIQVTKVSEPFVNPFIQAPGMNPVRTYEADVYRNGKKVETLTGVVFADQGLNDQLQHHASVRGLGLLPVYGSEDIPPFGSEYESFMRSREKPLRETSTHTYFKGTLGEIAVPKPYICPTCGANVAPTVEAKYAHKRTHEK